MRFSDLCESDQKIVMSNMGRLKRREESRESMLEALKMAYRKHHMGDESIGWSELGDIMHDALCNEMGDDAYIEWLRSTRDSIMAL